MAHRLGVLQQTISLHLQEMPELAKLVNIDLSEGFNRITCREPQGRMIGIHQVIIRAGS
jgi:hypothetical protein